MDFNNNSTQIMLSDEPPRKRCIDPDYHTDGDDAWWVSKRKRMEKLESDMKEHVVLVMKNEKQEESVDEKIMHPSTTTTGCGIPIKDDSVAVKAVQRKKVVMTKREFEQEKEHVSATTGSISCGGESFIKDIQQKSRVH